MKSRVKIISIVLFLSVFITVVSADGQRAEWKEMTEKENEVVDKNIGLEFIGHLGEIDGDDENFLFYRPCDIAGDSEGNLYVLDEGNHCVKKFNKTGKHLATFGRFGQGPGEFQWLFSIDIDKDDNVYVADWMNVRLEVFSSQGKYLRSIKLMTPVHRIRVLRSGEIAIMNPRVGRDNSSSEEAEDGSKSFLPLIKIMDKNGRMIRKFGEGILFKTFPAINGGNRLVFTNDDDDNIYLTLLFQNRTEKFTSEGKLVLQTSRPVPDKMHSRRTKKPYMYTLISQGIDVDSQGRIWIITRIRRPEEEERSRRDSVITETDMYRLDVLDNKGNFLKSFPLKHFCDDIRIVDDKIYVLDQYRTMRFYIYRISENDSYSEDKSPEALASVD